MVQTNETASSTISLQQMDVAMHKKPLTAWLEQVLSSQALTKPRRLELAEMSGDAGFRHYWRLNTLPSMLAALAPPETENNEQFCKVSQWMLRHGVRAPKVFAYQSESGYLLLEDLGSRPLLYELDEMSVNGYYSEAMTMLLHLQSSPADHHVFPVYTAEKLKNEMDLFDDWFCGEFLGLSLSRGDVIVLCEAKNKLIERALKQPQVPVHRDFHSRNLMVLDDASLATIDFQDALVGPLTYDLVSLLRDCYIKWPSDQVDNWVSAYASLAASAELISTDYDLDAFRTDFDWMGLQRHIKVLGIFCRLLLRDGKPGYVADLPRVFEYVCEILARYKAFSELSGFFHTTLKPALEEKLRNR